MVIVYLRNLSICVLHGTHVAFIGEPIQHLILRGCLGRTYYSMKPLRCYLALEPHVQPTHAQLNPSHSNYMLQWNKHSSSHTSVRCDRCSKLIYPAFRSFLVAIAECRRRCKNTNTVDANSSDAFTIGPMLSEHACLRSVSAIRFLQDLSALFAQKI